MELENWFSAWGFNNNPFDYTSDADRDPYFEQAFIQNIGLRTSLSLEKPNPLVVFGIKGAGKSSIRRDLEIFLTAHTDKAITLSYNDFNDLLSEKNRGYKEIPAGKLFSEPTYQQNSQISLNDHLDNILRLGIEKLYKEHLSKLDNPHSYNLIKGNEEQIRRLILLMALYFMPNDIFKKVDGISKTMKIFKYKRRGYFLSSVARKRLVAEIYSKINGLPITVKDIDATIRTTGTDLYKPGDIPDDVEQRFTLLGYFIEIIQQLFGLTGIYLLVDRVDEHVSINGDSEKMRWLVTPLLSDQLLQVNCLGMLLFLPYELQDLRKKYRSDKIKTICPLDWTPIQIRDLIEKRMSLFSDIPVRLSDLFVEDGDKFARQIAQICLTPRNAFKFMERLVKEHCNRVDHEKRITSEIFDITLKKYLLEKEEVR